MRSVYSVTRLSSLVWLMGALATSCGQRANPAYVGPIVLDAGGGVDLAPGDDGASRGCSPPLLMCGTDCLDLQSSPTHCGACDIACSSDKICSQGSCVCAADQVLCGMTCVDTLKDKANCGACGIKCADTWVCSQGICAPNCSDTLANCSGSCVDLQSDRANCGTCGFVCSSAMECASGACSCTDGLTNCGGQCLN